MFLLLIIYSFLCGWHCSCFKRDLYEAGALPLYDPRLKPWVTHQQPLRGCTATAVCSPAPSPASYEACILDCLPLFAEQIGGVARSAEGVDTCGLCHYNL